MMPARRDGRPSYAAPVIRTRLAAASLAGLLAGAACGDDEPAPEPVADQVHAAVAEELGLAPTEITTLCPADAVPDAGASFECAIEVDGHSLTASVTFVDARRVSFRLDGRVIRRDELEASVRELLAAPERLGEPVTELTCGDSELVVLLSRDTVRCRGTAASGVSGFAEVGLDAGGNAEIRALTNR